MCGHAAKITLLQPGNRTCTYSVVSGYFWSSGYLGGASVHGVCSDTSPRCSAGFGCKVFGGQVIALSSFFCVLQPILEQSGGAHCPDREGCCQWGNTIGMEDHVVCKWVKLCMSKPLQICLESVFPEHCFIIRWLMFLTSPVSVFNIVADWFSININGTQRISL